MPILRKRRVSRGLAAEEGQGAKFSMHRKQGSVHSFLGSSGYSSAAGYQCSSNSRIFSRGMGDVNQDRW
ncbi:MAG: hypothetical protein SRB2_00251 [Desulfobacteraceae bacterium Eth-SRB2]|nr:MAG: hypothetical protein SRB2_00251 [Desulfobacteraceae bacterium Eth-SRB2]